MPATAWIHRTRAHAHAHGNVREHDGEHERPFLAKLSVFSGVSRLQRLLACARAWYQSSAISVTFRTLSRVSRGDLWKVPREGTFNSTVRPSKGRCSPVAAERSATALLPSPGSAAHRQGSAAHRNRCENRSGGLLPPCDGVDRQAWLGSISGSLLLGSLFLATSISNL